MATAATSKRRFTTQKIAALIFNAECIRWKNSRTARTIGSGNTRGRREDSEVHDPPIARVKKISRAKNSRANANGGKCLAIRCGASGRGPNHFPPATSTRATRQTLAAHFCALCAFLRRGQPRHFRRIALHENFRTFVVANKRHEP